MGIPFLTLNLRVRRKLFLVVETKNLTVTTTVMLQESFMTSLPRRDARFTASLQPRDTTMEILKHKEMASLLDLCATRTTNMIYLRTVLKLGLLNLKMRDSSKRLQSAFTTLYNNIYLI